LQYRFGRAGEIELEFPKGRQNTKGMFRYAHYIRPRVDRSEVTFENDGYEYALFDYYEGEGGPAASEKGVRVTSPGNKPKEVVLRCLGAATSNLGALSEVIPCDKENPLNMGECP
jgi:hypothetical protein